MARSEICFTLKKAVELASQPQFGTNFEENSVNFDSYIIASKKKRLKRNCFRVLQENSNIFFVCVSN